MEKIDELNEHSEHVREVLSTPPSSIVRVGTSVVFFIILIAILLCWFIKYPDVIRGKVVLTTETPPVKLVSRANGQLHKLHIKENSTVHKGDCIAEIESPMKEDAAIYLKEICMQIQLKIHDSLEQVIAFNDSIYTFGDIQQEYNNLKTTFNDYMVLLNNDYFHKQINYLKNQITFHQRLATISNRQITLWEKDLTNAEERYSAEEKLYNGQAIAKFDFLREEGNLNQVKQQVENTKKTYVQNMITITDYEKQLNDLDFEYSEKRRTSKESILSSLHNIQNYLNTWKQNYRLIAPFTGKVTYLEPLTENQFIQAGKELFVVIPEGKKHIGYIELPTQGYAKIKVGQKTMIKLNNYPHAEYGQLKAIVKEIGIIPNQDKYSVKVKLENGLISTYNKTLEFKPQMEGVAEIVTEDLTLLDRIFYSLRKLVNRE